MNKEDLMKKYGLSGNPLRGLTGATWGFFIGFAAVALYGPAAKTFKESMGLSGFLLGILVAVPQLTGSLLRIPFGAAVDQVGGKRPYLILFTLSLLGMAGLTSILFLVPKSELNFSYYYWVLGLGVLCGCGVATFSVGIPQVSYWFPQSKQGWALGIFGGLGNTAPGIFTLILPFALAALGLPGAYASWLVFLLLGTLLYAFVARDTFYFQLRRAGLSRDEAIKGAKELGQELIPSGQAVAGLKKSASIGRTWALVTLYFISFGGFLALTAWYPAYWSLYQGVDGRMAGVLTAVGFSLLASLVRVAGGNLADKVGGEKMALISYALIFLGAGVMVAARGFFPALVGEMILGAGMGLANAAVFKLVARYVPEAVGGASGWVGGLGAFGGFIVPPLLGLFADNYGKEGYAWGFVLYLIFALMGLAVSWGLKQYHGVRMAAPKAAPAR
ncbi:MAG TPA: MFS transporter [bacterium]|nr:MFS transporter [bacterium]